MPPAIMPRPPSADYIPLAPLAPLDPPHRHSLPAPRPWPTAAHTLLAYLRRRALFAAITAAGLVLLYLVLRFHLAELDLADLDADLDDDFFLDPGAPDASRTSYLPIRVTPAPAAPPQLEPVSGVPDACLERHFARGEPCFQSTVAPLDLVWTWVNGSDALLEHEKEAATAGYAAADPNAPLTSKTQSRQFRDHDELRHSLRSVLAAFRPHTRRLRLLTADFPVPATEPNLTLPAAWRLGQVPQWLDLAAAAKHRWRDGAVELAVTHHAEFFRPYAGTGFNSLAIESQLVHLQDVSENFIYMNDDLYFARPLTPATFYTAAFGTVLHFQSNLLVSASAPTAKTLGEWRALQHTNTLLSARFGVRARPYVLHEAKAAPRPLLRELAVLFARPLAETAAHRFRETRGGAPDVNAVWAAAQLLVERAREAALWAWVVARVGAPDGAWGAREAQQAWEELGGAWDAAAMDGAVLDVRAGPRETLVSERVEDVLRRAGVEPGVTTYLFSSLDGYAFAGLGQHGLPHFPSLDPAGAETARPRCALAYAECFVLPPDAPARAAEVFKHVAFRNPQCGDCIIAALVKASGIRGLAALLPAPERAAPARPYPPAPPAADVPHLPLVADWRAGDFSLAGAMAASGAAPGASVRAWTLRLLARYRYVVGGTPALFERLLTPGQVRSTLGRVDRDETAALVCLNDDVSSGDAGVGELMRAWQGKRWPERAAWERDE